MKQYEYIENKWTRKSSRKNSKNFNGETYPEYLPSFDEFINDIMELGEVDESVIQD